MGVVAGDIGLFKSSVVNDTVTNGGTISANEITSDVVNNQFPNVTHSERVAGGERYRKNFVKNKNVTTAFNNVAIYLSANSSAADYFRIKGGTSSDTQADADDYTDWAGSGVLNTGISASATELIVDYEHASGVYDSSELVIIDGTDTEYVTVGSSSAVSWIGTQATITLAAGTAKAHSSGVVIATMVDLSNLAAEDSAGIWFKEIWAAGVASYSGNEWRATVKGESA